MRAARAINSSVRSLLNSLYPGCGEIYTKRLASTKTKEPIVFIKMKTMSHIDAVKTGTLPKGFLESATVFSKTKNEANEWEVSGSGSKQKKQDRSR